MWRDIIVVKAAHLHAAARMQFKREHSMLCLVALVQSSFSRRGPWPADGRWLAWIDKRAARARRVIKGRRLHVRLLSYY